MYPIYVLLLSSSPKFQSASLYDQLFLRIKTSAQNDRKMTLNPTRSNLPHIWVTSVPDFQIPVSFTQWQTVFELQAILRQVHQMTPN